MVPALPGVNHARLQCECTSSASTSLVLTASAESVAKFLGAYDHSNHDPGHERRAERSDLQPHAHGASCAHRASCCNAIAERVPCPPRPLAPHRARPIPRWGRGRRTRARAEDRSWIDGPSTGARWSLSAPLPCNVPGDSSKYTGSSRGKDQPKKTHPHPLPGSSTGARAPTTRAPRGEGGSCSPTP